MTEAARALLAALDEARARQDDVRARRRRALALVERAVSGASPPRARARRLSIARACCSCTSCCAPRCRARAIRKSRASFASTTSIAHSRSRASRRTRRRYARAQAESFGSDNYFLSFFGDPRRDARWGWLVQGHHLAVSFTVADGKTAFLPMFVGATPLAVEEEVETGWSALAQEVTRGVELVTALTESQRKIAISPAEVPGDVLNGVGNKHRFTPAEGLRGADMTAEQRRLLRALVEEYVENADFDAADEQLAAIERAGWDNLSFTWRGAVGDLAEPFYYRVQGPRLIIELRNTANHVHTVTRDPANDYGEAWLGVSYRETITAAERSAAARRAAE